MNNKDKLKGLINSLKTSNELAAKQIEVNKRTLDLLGSLIIEPESLGKALYSDYIPSLSGVTMVGQPIEHESYADWWRKLPSEEVFNYRKKFADSNGLIPDSIIEELFKKETQQIEPINIKPEDMKAGEWYVDSEGWMFKFKEIIKDDIFSSETVFTKNKIYANNYGKIGDIDGDLTFRPATREEVIKYFPHEFEIPTHGGNDVPNIDRVTDEQL